METRTIHDRRLIAPFLEINPGLHLYALGDLDDRYWPHTRWYAGYEAGRLAALSFLYTRFDPPVFQALCEPAEQRAMARHLAQVVRLLPGRIYAHLSPGLEEALVAGWQLRPHGQHTKMLLTRPKYVDGHADADVVPLGAEDASALRLLYSRSYTYNAFDERTLETGLYFGIWGDRELVSAAGIHVAAPSQGVAALGNIATLPAWRGRGLATRVTARLCRRLLEDYRHIGLNVRSDNRPAQSCYRRLGFEATATYFEWTCQALTRG